MTTISKTTQSWRWADQDPVGTVIHKEEQFCFFLENVNQVCKHDLILPNIIRMIFITQSFLLAFLLTAEILILSITHQQIS